MDLMVAVSCGLTLQICLIIALSFRCRRWRQGFVTGKFHWHGPDGGSVLWFNIANLSDHCSVISLQTLEAGLCYWPSFTGMEHSYMSNTIKWIKVYGYTSMFNPRFY